MEVGRSGTDHLYGRSFSVSAVVLVLALQMGVRLIILAALGLGALYLIHLLAQDYQSIRGRLLGRLLFKRDLSNSSSHFDDMYSTTPLIKWDFILSQDPIKCVRSLICQIATKPEENQSEKESIFIEMLRFGNPAEWGYKEIMNAYHLGKQSGSTRKCMNQYFTCPFRSDTMMYILNLFA